MKIVQLYQWIRLGIALFVLYAPFLPYAASAEPLALGGGEPGLKVIYVETNQAAIFVDESWTVGTGLVGGYDNRKIDVLFDQNYGLKEKIRNRTWTDTPEQLYPFDVSTAFTCDPPNETELFSMHGDHLIVTKDVYSLACSRYGLSTNQLFLGTLGTNIYYWAAQDPRKVFFRPVGEVNATNFFELPKGMIDLMGVTRGVKDSENVGFVVLQKSKGFFHYSPNEFSFIEVSFKNVKHLKSDKQ